MIQISGKSFQLQDTLPLDQIEKNIIQHMQNDQVTYSYHSLDELLFEIKVRKNIIKSATEMNESQAVFTSFEYAKCNPKYWQLTKAGGFLIRPDVRPSNAIMDIYRNSSLYAFECATAAVIIYYHATLRTIGDQLFDQLFQQLYLYSWHTDTDLGLVTFYSDHFIPGDMVYFQNPDYSPQTPWFRGVNAVLMDDGRFFGHGFSIRSSDEIVKLLNDYRKTGSKQSAYLSNLVSRLSFDHLSRLSKWQTRNKVYKWQSPVVHHNKSSISHLKYQKYVLKMVYQLKQ